MRLVKIETVEVKAKKTLSFLKGLVVAGTGLEPVTFGL